MVTDFTEEVYKKKNIYRKPPKLPLPLRFCQPAGGGPSHGHRQCAQKIDKDRTCGSGDILADRQINTDIHTHAQTYSLQYFTTTPAGEVIINLHLVNFHDGPELCFARFQVDYRQKAAAAGLSLIHI